MISNTSKRWMQFALINFAVTAFAGMAVRYKVTFPFPQMEFSKLLHAHSHFAFAGWVSTALFTLLCALFVPQQILDKPRYSIMFLLNQFTSYGMLVSFLIQEYGPVSISFSTANIFVTYAYAIMIWRDAQSDKTKLSGKALRAALVFLIISSIGPYALAYIKSANVFNGMLYHNAIYWYLHFQYNGWFSFSVFALFLRGIEMQGVDSAALYKRPFRLLLFACAPVYLLSVLWVVPPLWVYLVAGTGGLAQIAALIMILPQLRRNKTEGEKRSVKILLLLATIAFSLKLLLQLLSVFPTLNQFVFGHRPVIIGYLHLVMLGFVSFFLLATALRNQLLQLNNTLARYGLWIFVSGVLWNELGLMLQGFSGILFTPMNWIPISLFVAAATMFTGLFLFAFSQLNKANRSTIETGVTS